MIQAKIVADSICNGHRITTMEVTMPRFILAELNTHRMFSRNSASSRAIPTKKMLKSILDNPFIPIAWQKDHSGMQGTEYFEQDQKFNLEFLKEYMFKRLQDMYRDSKDQAKEDIIIDQRVLTMYSNMFDEFSTSGAEYTLTEFWLMIRDRIMQAVILLYCLGVTKQLCNRLLEPFMWQTVLITATEYENFFALRCPQYEIPNSRTFEGRLFRSRKDVIAALKNNGQFQSTVATLEAGVSEVDWLMTNKGGAEIHMMATAEAMWDAMNASTPQQLKEGEWHLPYGDQITDEDMQTFLASKSECDWDEKTKFDLIGILKGVAELAGKDLYGKLRRMIATARCAQVSYTVMDAEGKPMDYNRLIALHDRLSSSGHWSCFEHCARAMNRTEHNEYHFGTTWQPSPDSVKGWCGNFKGWIQYRKMFDNENIVERDFKIS